MFININNIGAISEVFSEEPDDESSDESNNVSVDFNQSPDVDATFNTNQNSIDASSVLETELIDGINTDTVKNIDESISNLFGNDLDVVEVSPDQVGRSGGEDLTTSEVRRSNLYINVDLFLDDEERGRQAFANTFPVNIPSPIRDNFRYYSGFYWYENSIPAATVNNDDDAPILGDNLGGLLGNQDLLDSLRESVSNVNIANFNNIEYFNRSLQSSVDKQVYHNAEIIKRTEHTNEDGAYFTKTKMKITPDGNKFQGTVDSNIGVDEDGNPIFDGEESITTVSPKWRKYLFGIGGVFEQTTEGILGVKEDFAFHYSEYKNTDQIPVQAVYNYLNDDYERKSLREEETLLPNIYFLKHYLDYNNNDRVNYHSTINNNLSFNDVNSFYLDEWSVDIDRASQLEEAKMDAFSKYLLFDQTKKEINNDIEDMITQFPLYTKIQLKDLADSEFNDVLSSVDYKHNFFKNIQAKTVALNEFGQDESEDVLIAENRKGKHEVHSIQSWSVLEWMNFIDDPLLILLDRLEQSSEVEIPDGALDVIRDTISNVIDFDATEDDSDDSNIADSFSEVQGALDQLNDIFDDGLPEQLEDSNAVQSIRDLLAAVDEINDFGTYLNFSTEEVNDFQQAILKITFLSKIKNFIKKNHRSIEDVYTGKLASKDVVGYNIYKYEINTQSPVNPGQFDFFGELIKNGVYAGDSEIIDSVLQDGNLNLKQVSFLPNFESTETFYDTQIQYGEEYVYVVKPIVFVLGNKYFYSTSEDDLNDDGSLDVEVYNFPAPKLFEVPLERVVLSVEDKDPLPPDIDFKKYNGIHDTVLIRMFNSIGSYTGIKETFSGPINGVEFRTDDVPRAFEIYRVSSPPSSYEDFETGKFIDISTQLESNNTQFASSMGYRDSIQANQEYYYMFRTRDYHNNTSTFSDIYKVKLVKDGDKSYLEYDIYNFNENENRQDSMSFYRYFNVQPAIQQRIVQYGSEEANQLSDFQFNSNNIKVGPDTGNVWGKKFKIRVKSKKTGKTFDINFTLDYNARGLLYNQAAVDITSQIITSADSFTDALKFLLIEQELELI